MATRLAVGDLVFVVEDHHFSHERYRKEFLRDYADRPGYVARLLEGADEMPRACILWKKHLRDEQGAYTDYRMANLPLRAVMAIE